MTNLYVFALVGQAARAFSAAGHRIEFVELESVYAAVERGRRVPAVSEAALRAQHQVVAEIANRVETVLPARFGAYVEARELRDIVSQRRETILDALALVRGRRQMTARLLVGDRAGSAAALSDPRPAATGTGYLESRRAAAAPPPLPEALADFATAVRTHVVAERVEAGGGRVFASLYHLVDIADVKAYTASAARVRRGIDDGALTVSGPWPPYAFAPDLWA